MAPSRRARRESDDPSEDFQVGDSIAARGAMVQCPYCGEAVEITLDPGSGNAQQYVEDCEICCRPWTVQVRYASDGTAAVSITALDG